VPGTIPTPAREGVEWLAPEVREQLGPIGHDAFGGRRTFDFVVRLERAGTVDLGELALPFWDPDQKKYDSVRVALGTVRVKPGAGGGAAGAAAAEPELLQGLPAPRDGLAGSRAGRSHWDDSPPFWVLGVGAWPVAFGFAVVGRAIGARVSRAWRSRRASPAAELKARIAAAHEACGGKDARQADAAIARALEAAAVAHGGVSVRDAVGKEIEHRLQSAGIAPDAAAKVSDLLRECEAARFAPDAADLVAARDRWQRAQGAIGELERRG
jgi:hypothetical protein